MPTFSLIYLNAGVSAMVAYARGLLLLTPAWILYVMCVMLGSPRIGFPAALLLGICIYVLGLWLLLRWLQRSKHLSRVLGGGL